MGRGARFARGGSAAAVSSAPDREAAAEAGGCGARADVEGFAAHQPLLFCFLCPLAPEREGAAVPWAEPDGGSALPSA